MRLSCCWPWISSSHCQSSCGSTRQVAVDPLSRHGLRPRRLSIRRYSARFRRIIVKYHIYLNQLGFVSCIFGGTGFKKTWKLPDLPWVRTLETQAPSTLIRFQTQTELFCSVFKKIRVHVSFSPVHTTTPYSFWKRFYTLSFWSCSSVANSMNILNEKRFVLLVTDPVKAETGYYILLSLIFLVL